MTVVAKKPVATPADWKVVDIASLPGLTKAQIKARLASKARAGRVAEMRFRDAGIKPGQL